MYQPQSYEMAMLFMLISMVCWGSWANTMKLAPGWRFQSYYWDYAAGVLLTSLMFGLTLGATDSGPASFWNNLRQADAAHLLFALAGGVVFNLANVLLVAAIEIAGLAVAFPVGIGLAIVVAAPLNYAMAPRGNPLLLFGGAALVVLAIIVDALAYRKKESARQRLTAKGIGISAAAGLLMGTFYPFVTRAVTGEQALGPYTVVFVFSIGLVLCTVPVNGALSRWPVTGGGRVGWKDYLGGTRRWHLLGIAGGLVWCIGMVLNFTASRAELVGPATSYGIGQGATMVSALWGVFVWREFAGAPPGTRALLAWMFILFAAGLGALAAAPVVKF
jgi:glucose uptake protein